MMVIVFRRFFLGLIVALSFLLIAWGSTGHRRINHDANLSYNIEMQQFESWTTTLADHASDADYRKSEDPTEGPKHYIDIDNYEVFVQTGRIPQTLDSVLDIYGSSFVVDNGTLPWATLSAYDTLKQCFVRHDWSKSVLVAADLGHYVADGHMPLHVTANYNGQFTGNNGIHSRYESAMINAYINQIEYEGSPATFISNVNSYVFEYIYQSNSYVDTILIADDYAKTINSNTNSTAYKQALWQRTKHCTNQFFKGASHALACLIYTAWKEAGSPEMSAGIEDHLMFGLNLTNASPNPFAQFVTIQFTVQKPSTVGLEIRNSSGKTVQLIDAGFKACGNYSTIWQPEGLPKGIYFVVLKNTDEVKVKRLIYN